MINNQTTNVSMVVTTSVSNAGAMSSSTSIAAGNFYTNTTSYSIRTTPSNRILATNIKAIELNSTASGFNSLTLDGNHTTVSINNNSTTIVANSVTTYTDGATIDASSWDFNSTVTSESSMIDNTTSTMIDTTTAAVYSLNISADINSSKTSTSSSTFVTNNATVEANGSTISTESGITGTSLYITRTLVNGQTTADTSSATVDTDINIYTDIINGTTSLPPGINEKADNTSSTATGIGSINSTIRTNATGANIARIDSSSSIDINNTKTIMDFTSTSSIISDNPNTASKTNSTAASFNVGSCYKPEVPEFAKITPDREIYSLNSTIIYSCIDGYVLGKGTISRNCVNQGAWTGGSPLCLRE